MGLASTQARLLYCTSRKADLQYDLLQACAQEQMYTQKSCVAAEQKARKYNEFIATQVGDPDNSATISELFLNSEAYADYEAQMAEIEAAEARLDTKKQKIETEIQAIEAQEKFCDTLLKDHLNSFGYFKS